ncbi:hypothetical protein QOT17_019565 [Balamuthia mandrillaris]
MDPRWTPSSFYDTPSLPPETYEELLPPMSESLLPFLSGLQQPDITADFYLAPPQLPTVPAPSYFGVNSCPPPSTPNTLHHNYKEVEQPEATHKDDGCQHSEQFPFLCGEGCHCSSLLVPSLLPPQARVQGGPYLCPPRRTPTTPTITRSTLELYPRGDKRPSAPSFSTSVPTSPVKTDRTFTTYTPPVHSTVRRSSLPPRPRRLFNSPELDERARHSLHVVPSFPLGPSPPSLATAFPLSPYSASSLASPSPHSDVGEAYEEEEQQGDQGHEQEEEDGPVIPHHRNNHLKEGPQQPQNRVQWTFVQYQADSFRAGGPGPEQPSLRKMRRLLMDNYVRRCGLYNNDGDGDDSNKENINHDDENVAGEPEPEAFNTAAGRCRQQKHGTAARGSAPRPFGKRKRE